MAEIKKYDDNVSKDRNLYILEILNVMKTYRQN